MKKKLLLFSSMFLSVFSIKAQTLSERIDGLFKPLVEDYLVPVIFWDPIKAMGFDIGADVLIVVVWLVFGALFFTFRMKFINFRAFKHALSKVVFPATHVIPNNSISSEAAANIIATASS